MKSFFQLIRWQNLLFTSIILWVMEKWVAVPILDQWRFGEQMPWWVLLCLMIAVGCIAAGGYVINDYFDIKIDRINRPDKVLVTTVFSKQQTMRIFQVLTAVGLLFSGVVAYWAHSWTLFLLCAMTTGLLWFYSASYKRQLIIGNLIVAFASALTPLSVAIANVDYLYYRYAGVIEYTPIPKQLYLWIGGFVLFAFLLTWAREIIKDLQDQMGDRELECHSLPIVIGDTWTKVIVTALLVGVMALIVYIGFWVVPFPHTWSSLSTRYIAFGLLVPLAGELALLWAARIPSDYKNAQLLLKFIMFIGVLYAFVIAQMV